jgi:transcriptional regulator with XRE-family HTH domain
MRRPHKKRKRAPNTTYVPYFDLGAKLKQCRIDLRLIQSDVKRATGVALMTISDIERGETVHGLPGTRARLEKWLNQHGYYINEKKVA